MIKKPDWSTNYHGVERIIYKKIVDWRRPFSVELAGETLPNKKYHISTWSGGPYVYEYVLSGKGVLEADGVENPIEAGDFYMISNYKHCQYYSNSKDPYRKIWVNCRGQLNRAFCQALNIDNPFLIISFPEAEKFIRSIHKTLSDTSLDTHSKDIACAADILTLLSGVSDMINFEHYKQQKYTPYRIRKYIDDHICEPITLEDIKRTFLISQTHLNHIFSQAYNISPYKYIVEQRIKLACSMLVNTNLPISEIAEQLVFADSHYFSNVFKKHMGCSPSTYRKRSQDHQLS